MRRSGWAVGLGERVSLWLLMRVLLCVIICSFAFYAFLHASASRVVYVFFRTPRGEGGGLVLCSSFAKMEEGDEEEEEEEAGRRKQEG